MTQTELTETVKDLIATWEPADQKWLEEKVPAELHITAARHGRKLFSITMQAGTANFCLNTLLQGIHQGPGKKMLVVLSGVFDDIFKRALHGEGCTAEQFKECRTDIERVSDLINSGQPQGNNVSKGGIILNS